MLKLYGGARTRASLVAWYLEELGQPYEAVAVDLAAGEHRQPPFLALNPFGKVPAVVDDEFSLWESGAILLYLAEKFGELQTLQDRAIAAQWVLFANATLGPGLFVEANRAKEAPRLLGSLNTLLSQRDYLVGDRLGVADIAVGSYLAYVPMFFPDFDLSPYPAVQSYISRLTQRPAYQNTIGRR
ncbi:glutathione S-transferase family protein [Synechococcus elongatus]|uniref:Glutathione S-transferase family protein n=1 Tax=Synechococcus elongatus PCC 11802 TaxID=2283154 RepID=A0AAT9JS00_SYNEL|nr:glutathione S-transferase family protein [Synechococcus elongatus]QFZ92315.1 glutathione S-transferase family protein [Synechococcus elongatus PCC 11802]